MEVKITWLVAFTLIYWTYCIGEGLWGKRARHTFNDDRIGERRFLMWTSSAVAVAISFSGWIFIGRLPELRFDAYTWLYTIAVPLTGVMVLHGRWMIGRRLGYVPPRDAPLGCDQGMSLRILTASIALLAATPYVALELGVPTSILTVPWEDNTSLFPAPLEEPTRHIPEISMLSIALLYAIISIYTLSGLIRAIGSIKPFRFSLLIAAIVTAGMVVYGAESLRQGIEARRPDAPVPAHYLVDTPQLTVTVSDHLRLRDPRITEFILRRDLQLSQEQTESLDQDERNGALWPAALILTYLATLIAIRSVPARPRR